MVALRNLRVIWGFGNATAIDAGRFGDVRFRGTRGCGRSCNAVLEHDPLTLEIADHIFDFGPKAGRLGGELTAQGTLSQIKKNKASLTGAYLSGKKKLPIPEKRRTSKGFLTIE